MTHPSSSTMNHSFYLNGTHKNIIDAAIQFLIDDIIQTFIARPKLAIAALITIVDDSEKYKSLFIEKNIYDNIKNIQRILTHPCPQNRMRGDASAMGRDYAQYTEGVKDGRVYYWENGFGSKILSEKQGLLGLTARTDTMAISKEAVIGYILQTIFNQISALKSMTPQLIKLINANEATVQELMQNCEMLNVAQLNEIGVEGLKTLLIDSAATIRLLNKTQMPVQTLIALDDALRMTIITYSLDFVRLTEEARWSYKEILALPPEIIGLCLEYAKELIQSIKTKNVTYNDICLTTPSAFYHLIDKGKEPSTEETPAVAKIATPNRPTTEEEHTPAAQVTNSQSYILSQLVDGFAPITPNAAIFHNPNTHQTLSFPEVINPAHLPYYLFLLEQMGLHRNSALASNITHHSETNTDTIDNDMENHDNTSQSTQLSHVQSFR